jgi:hypothetical protein
MFHNHGTPRCIYITADKLCLNKWSQLTTHPSRIKTAVPQQHVTSASVPKLFQMLLAALVSSYSQAVGVASELSHASMAKHRLLLVMEQLGSASGHPIQFFSCCDRARVVGSDWLQSLYHRRKTTLPRQLWGCHPAVWNLVEMTLEINLYELTAPFQCCVLETERMQTRGNSSRFWNRKCIKWAKKIVSSSNLLLLRWEISLCRDVLNRQSVMLIKYENFGAFLFWLLRQENFLTRDALNKSYCIWKHFFHWVS